MTKLENAGISSPPSLQIPRWWLIKRILLYLLIFLSYPAMLIDTSRYKWKCFALTLHACMSQLAHAKLLLWQCRFSLSICERWETQGPIALSGGNFVNLVSFRECIWQSWCTVHTCTWTRWNIWRSCVHVSWVPVTDSLLILNDVLYIHVLWLDHEFWPWQMTPEGIN